MIINNIGSLSYPAATKRTIKGGRGQDGRPLARPQICSARGVFSKCLSLIHHNDSYAFETGTRFYTPNVKGVNYNFKTDSQ